jgi:hypothetical protein
MKKQILYHNRIEFSCCDDIFFTGVLDDGKSLQTKFLFNANFKNQKHYIGYNQRRKE